MEGMAFVISVIYHDINPLHISLDLRDELMLIPPSSRHLNEWFCLWDPICPVHEAHWDVIKV